MTAKPLTNPFTDATPPSGKLRAILDAIEAFRPDSPGLATHFYSPVELSQMEGAYSQLETAVYLFLLGAPPAAVHTLAGAAQEVLRGLVKRHFREIGGPLPPSELDANASCLGRLDRNEVRTFLKHALHPDSGGERTVTVDANENMLWIWDCLQSWRQLGNSSSALAQLFLTWLLTGHSRGILSGNLPDDLRAEILEELGIEYPVPRVSHFGPWLIEYLNRNPETKVPGWVLAASSVTTGATPVWSGLEM